MQSTACVVSSNAAPWTLRKTLPNLRNVDGVSKYPFPTQMCGSAYLADSHSFNACEIGCRNEGRDVSLAVTVSGIHFVFIPGSE